MEAPAAPQMKAAHTCRMATEVMTVPNLHVFVPSALTKKLSVSAWYVIAQRMQESCRSGHLTLQNSEPNVMKQSDPLEGSNGLCQWPRLLLGPGASFPMPLSIDIIGGSTLSMLNVSCNSCLETIKVFKIACHNAPCVVFC